MDLEHLRASDGTGEAILAHVQSVRTIGSTVLELDNIDNWNAKCIVVTGTPNANGFIAAAGMTVMYGHTSAGDFIIDGYAPGYSDAGNTTTEVAIVKMTTNWADALVTLLQVAHNNNGTIKNDAISSETMFTDNVDPVKRDDETMFDHVASGGVWSGDAYASTRNASMTALVAYINGQRGTISAVTARSFTASKDTYVDILNTAGVFSLVYTEVANNAASPALAANSIRIGIIVTGASNIANAGSVNQGEPDKVLPIASSIPYTTTDSIGNLICPRDPNRRLIAYRQKTTSQTINSTSVVDVTGLNLTFVADGISKYKLSTKLHATSPGGVGRMQSRAQQDGADFALQAGYIADTSAAYGLYTERIWIPSAGSHTMKLQTALPSVTCTQYGDTSGFENFIKVERA